MSQREVDRLLTCAIPGHPYALSRRNGRASSRTGGREDYSRAREAASLSSSYVLARWTPGVLAFEVIEADFLRSAPGLSCFRVRFRHGGNALRDNPEGSNNPRIVFEGGSLVSRITPRRLRQFRAVPPHANRLSAKGPSLAHPEVPYQPPEPFRFVPSRRLR